MPGGGEVREYVTLPDTPDEPALAVLLATPGGAALSARSGTDAAGRARTVLTLAHPDPEVVAATRQNLLRACRERGLRAFVV
ncbi:hypothetical protein E5F05_11740 [Deinococcus metallilatus]|uniref:Uncharacterized protein n=1 Tax=Deinococcus metallilatus TaxID=1211322 RepID=A0AAJ5JYS8_9DEIO|nr:hypothetical protein [Deinococcus metallilatus]MBB5295293.1 hypothetical protein [Deinococcus metallilatus]QBY08551.1 hypothetical protein E5F05_11740 [Deinococcus metallilatus]RXJ10813.1 hypothetical protein ERJ73_10565 [Deinococcus metallilatus]TLK22148.1 hypothetical protein FCS05_18000 [Deinococcus metallilatus]GMA15068.1 hypothetical protein GCM10025871_13990 [Deinococcus metallilatus]